MISPEQIFLKAVGVETATVAGERVVLDPEGRVLRGLNPTGARVWDLLDSRLTVRQLAQSLAVETGVDETRALVDVSAFMQLLVDRRLVTPSA